QQTPGKITPTGGLSNQTDPQFLPRIRISLDQSGFRPRKIHKAGHSSLLTERTTAPQEKQSQKEGWSHK
ncbi:MAG: hypothetical protein EBZ05_08275, partial [Verrucomicrobia bacterium]|nr:hypothetical protein [Verrucomicrobiota bacterium]